MNRCIALAAVGCVVFHCAPVQAQKLSRLRDEVRSAEAQPKDKKQNSGECDSEPYFGLDDEDNDDGLSNLLASGVFFAVGSPFWVPAGLARDDWGQLGYFLHEPYWQSQDGLIVVEPSDSTPHSAWLARVRAETGTDFDGITLAGGRLLFDTVFRFGIDSELNYRDEELNRGGDQLWTGDFNIVFRFAQSPRVQMRSGIGFNWLADEADSEFGFNFTYGGDFFPCRPWVISAEFDLGTLGHAGLIRGRATGGLLWDRVEFYTGYDYFDVGSVQIHSLIGGISIWL